MFQMWWWRKGAKSKGGETKSDLKGGKWRGKMGWKKVGVQVSDCERNVNLIKSDGSQLRHISIWKYGNAIVTGQECFQNEIHNVDNFLQSSSNIH